MYEQKNIMHASILDSVEAQGHQDEPKKVDRSVLVARNLMFWTSAAISCAAIYFLLSAVT